jgi:hypothetical protein
MSLGKGGLMAADTWNSYFNRLDRATFRVVQITSDEISKLLRDNLYDVWYKTSSGSYVRTYDLINSITSSKVESAGKRSYQSKVFFDPDKIRAERPENSPLGQHMSFDNSIAYEGMSIGEWVGSWIDQGMESPTYKIKGTKYVQQTMDELKTLIYTHT